jgi:mannose-6-phosphate isomerase-like protein (cupin superfamily)
VSQIVLRIDATERRQAYKISAVRPAARLDFGPLTSQDEAGDAAPALAAAAHDTPAFLSGTLRLVPGAHKDTEATDDATHVFTVMRGQPRALQVRIEGVAVLLDPGDHFFVPPNMNYSFTNHSKIAEADVAFVVIRNEAAEDEPDAHGSQSQSQAQARDDEQDENEPTTKKSGRRTRRK